MSAPNESDVSFSAPLDGAEASGSGYTASYSSGCEYGAYGDVSLSSDSIGRTCSSKRAKVMPSGRKLCKPTGKFRVSWTLPEHITASK